jgi:hypothetical protein
LRTKGAERQPLSLHLVMVRLSDSSAAESTSSHPDATTHPGSQVGKGMFRPRVTLVAVVAVTLVGLSHVCHSDANPTSNAPPPPPFPQPSSKPMGIFFRVPWVSEVRCAMYGGLWPSAVASLPLCMQPPQPSHPNCTMNSCVQYVRDHCVQSLLCSCHPRPGGRRKVWSGQCLSSLTTSSIVAL